MKKIFSLLLVALASVATMNAQIVKGDMNDDKSLTMQDANAIVNVFVTGQEPVGLSVVPLADYEALEKENAALRDELSKLKGETSSHESVDLGLSVKWATCNVGASKPEEYGNYYAWGEVEPKEDYSWSTYKWMASGYSDWRGVNKYTFADGQTNGCWYSNGTFVGDNKTVLEPEDDAAHVNWGGNWRMPTKAEQDELRNNCTWTWTTQNGVNGRKVTGPNGNSIFLPAAGYRYDTSLSDAGFHGYYWSSSLYTGGSNYACYLDFYLVDVGWNISNRYRGRSVRPVCL